MKKHIFTIDFILTAIGSFFSGLLDGFSYLYRNKTFTTVQTGNLIKTFIAFVYSEYFYAVYLIILLVTFCLFILIFVKFCKFLKTKKINYHYVLMPLIIILLIPSFVWEYNPNNNLDYRNIISGICLSMISSIMVVSFRNIKLKYDYKVLFNLTFVTGNLRTMMLSLFDFFETKNKDKLHLFYLYLIMIGFFCLGATSSALFHLYQPGIWQRYSIILFIGSLSLLMMLLSHIRYKHQKIK